MSHVIAFPLIFALLMLLAWVHDKHTSGPRGRRNIY